MMIENILIDYLSACLNPLPVYAEEPEEAPCEFIVIEKTSGGSENFLKNASFTIQSFSETMEKAAKLNDIIIDTMSKFAVLPQISNCQVNSDYNYTDTSEKRYRYQALIDVFYF